MKKHTVNKAKEKQQAKEIIINTLNIYLHCMFVFETSQKQLVRV